MALDDINSLGVKREEEVDKKSIAYKRGFEAAMNGLNDSPPEIYENDKDTKSIKEYKTGHKDGKVHKRLSELPRPSEGGRKHRKTRKQKKHTKKSRKHRK